jgi:hypothetical protein
VQLSKRCAPAMQMAHRATALPSLLARENWFNGKLLFQGRKRWLPKALT